MFAKSTLFSLAVTSVLCGLQPLAAAPDTSLASSTVQSFRVSDKVEILRNDQWRRGEIVAVQTSGQNPTYRVRYLDVGFEENGVGVSRLRKSTVRPIARRFFEVGTPVGVKYGDSYKEGIVTAFQIGGGRDYYKVAFEDLSKDDNVKPHQLVPVTELSSLGVTPRVYDLDTEAAIAEMLDVHNEWRAKVGVQPLTWSDELAEHSQQWADVLAAERTMYHRPISTNPYGENLATSRQHPMTPRFVVNLWGDEDKYYDYGANQCLGPMCGHYTQMIWHETTEVGCAMTKDGDFEAWVCSYNPPGNYSGERPY